LVGSDNALLRLDLPGLHLRAAGGANWSRARLVAGGADNAGLPGGEAVWCRTELTVVAEGVGRTELVKALV
jgi:hypothetical protein